MKFHRGSAFHPREQVNLGSFCSHWWLGSAFDPALPTSLVPCSGTRCVVLPAGRCAVCYSRQGCESPSCDGYLPHRIIWAETCKRYHSDILLPLTHLPNETRSARSNMVDLVSDRRCPHSFLEVRLLHISKMLTNRHNICPGEQRKLLFFFLAGLIHAGIM